VFLERRVYAVFGAFGIALAEKVFKDSLLFPFALSLIGVGVIAAGLAYHNRRGAITLWIASRIPTSLRQLRPVHAR
jgi:hypothetical protein